MQTQTHTETNAFPEADRLRKNKANACKPHLRRSCSHGDVRAGPPHPQAGWAAAVSGTGQRDHPKGWHFPKVPPTGVVEFWFVVSPVGTCLVCPETRDHLLQSRPWESSLSLHSSLPHALSPPANYCYSCFQTHCDRVSLPPGPARQSPPWRLTRHPRPLPPSPCTRG